MPYRKTPDMTLPVAAAAGLVTIAWRGRRRLVVGFVVVGSCDDNEVEDVAHAERSRAEGMADEGEELEAAG